MKLFPAPPFRHPRFRAGAALLGVLLLAAGCNVIPPPQTDATRTYVLTEALPTVPATPAATTGTVRVGLSRIELRPYLDTRDMVLREGPNQIEPQDYARWAEPLDVGISRLLQSQLGAAPNVARVYVQPFPFDADRDCDVRIVVLRCEGNTEGGRHATARFAASIEVTTTATPSRVLAHRIFVAPPADWDGHDFGQLAALLSDDLAALGREIIAALPAAPPASP